jgi:hypothetical protein
MSKTNNYKRNRLFLIFLWVIIAIGIPLICFGIFAPEFDRLDYEEKINSSLLYLIYWLGWVPYHIFIWFMILPGNLMIRYNRSKRLSIFVFICVASYFLVTICGWVWLIIRDMQP